MQDPYRNTCSLCQEKNEIILSQEEKISKLKNSSKKEILKLKKTKREQSFQSAGNAAIVGLCFGGLAATGLFLGGLIYGCIAQPSWPPPEDCFDVAVVLNAADSSRLSCMNAQGNPTGAKLTVDMLADGKSVLARCVCNY